MKKLIVILSILAFVSCGSGGGETKVTSVALDFPTISLGTTSPLRVVFQVAVLENDNPTDSSNPFKDSAQAEVVVLLPKGTGFVSGTSELSDSFGGTAQPLTPDDVIECRNEESAVFYHFDAGELPVTGVLDKIEKSITFVVSGDAEFPLRYIKAAADRTIANPCAISGQEQADVSVLRTAVSEEEGL